MMEKKVHFKNSIWTIAGCLFLPDNLNEANQYAAVVLSHPGGGVKEQTSKIYAEGMAEAGFIALTFDATHQGESEGSPRLLDNPFERVEDIKCAVDFLTTLPYVDNKRIGAIGQCAGAGYAVSATMTDRRIKAVCGICLTNPGASTRQGWNGKKTVAEQIALLEEIGKQRTAEANGAEVRMGHFVPEANEIDENTDPDMIEASNYYRTSRAMHPNSPNLYRFTGLAFRMMFDAYAQIPDYLTQPFLVIAGSNAGSLWQSKKGYELANEPKEMCVFEGAGHFDLYDNPKYIRMALEKMSAFFLKYLQNN